MSGSSLDGLDIGVCDFSLLPTADRPVQAWSLLAAETIAYPPEWVERLRRAPQLSGRELWRCHADLGHYIGGVVSRWLEERSLAVDLVASHGHTVFHFPTEGFTTQIGDGAAIAAHARRPVIDQFRSADLARGGQGAPLAPLADRHLFADYDCCLNIGGIINLSVKSPRGYVAFDVTGANQVLDALAGERGLAYDDDGALARRGQVLPELLVKADALPYLAAPYPKSLGNDWVQEQLLPLFHAPAGAVEDRLHTAVRHMARQTALHLARVIDQEGLSSDHYRMLVTGGGAFNGFLLECLQDACREVAPVTVEKPAAQIIQFKEAALMALAGALRWINYPNVLATATGADQDSVGGAIHYGD